LVVDYLYSALFCPESDDLPRAIITVNREAEFFRESIAQGSGRAKKSIKTAIAGARLRRYERNAYARSAGVIALSKPDIPPYLPSAQAICITPYLDEPAEHWRFTDSRTAFFVGNIAHYPNRLAIEFIARGLAPCIAAHRSDIQIKIIGADAESVPAEWRHPIVSYLGVSDASTVRSMFQTSDVLLCPIKNDFGMKFKVAEAAAYATPFVASPETAQCVPYLVGLPQLNLQDPEAAAGVICGLIGNQPELQRLSALIRSRHRAFVASQKNIWSRSLSGLAAPAGREKGAQTSAQRC
jgi:glycosyltransferase involved in cell wall biosynthesis